MGYLLAIVFLALGVLGLVAYGGTPHAGPTALCGPIDFLGYTFIVNYDCRYISLGEVAAAVVFIFLAVFAVLSARPHKAPPTAHR